MFESNDELSNTATSSASQIVMGEAPDRNLALDLVRVTEAAALAAGHWMGRGQKEAGDGAQRRLLSASVAEILSIISVALNKPLRDLTAFVLDKPRHQKLIAEIREAGARVLLRTNRDVAGALMAAMPNSGVDVMMGIGGTPEGVIAACAVRAMGGAMLGQLAPRNEEERKAIESAGLDINCVLTETDLVQSDDVFFAATGITDGMIVPGVRDNGRGASTVSIVMRSKTGTVREIYAEHRLDKLRVISAVAYQLESNIS